MVEGLGDPVQGHGTVLDAGACALVEADERAPGGDGQLHDLDHLLAVDLTEGTTEDSAVLGEDANLAAVDGSPAGDDSVGHGLLGGHTEVGGAVYCEHVSFDEGAFVEEVVQAVACGEAALIADFLVGFFAHGRSSLLALAALAQQSCLPWWSRS